jgi:uncharacterized protein YdaU (DUF1376 family)
LSAGKNDIYMPLFIGDYLADTMHLSTEQHGAYLLLLFHLWRRGAVPDDDTALAKITGLSRSSWANARGVLAEFFRIENGFWQHGRVERERMRVAARQQILGKRGEKAARSRWDKQATSNAQALLLDAIPEPEPYLEPDSEPESISASRHFLFRQILGEYWKAKNHACPEMPWEGRDAKALSDFLAASPQLSEAQFRQMLGNRARSAVAHGDRVYLWIANLTRYQEEMTVYNKPASAGGHGSRAEINRNSVRNAVEQAWDMAQEHTDRVREIGAEPASLADPGVLVADGGRPG